MRPIALLIGSLLAPLSGWANVPRCPQNQPPADARPLTGPARQLHGVLAKSLSGRAALASSASVAKLCVTAEAVFVEVDWLRAEHIGPIGTHLAYGLMAYAVGVHRYSSQPGKGSGATADLSGAWHIGCAYALAGIREGRVSFLTEGLSVETGARTNDSAWRAVIARGFAECGGK